MSTPENLDVMRLLAAAATDPQAKAELFELVKTELHRRARRLMKHERPDHTLQPTILVHDAFLALVGDSQIRWQDQAQFFRLASRAYRQILIDHARKHRAGKRGGGKRPAPIDQAPEPTDAKALEPETLLAVNEALERLALNHPESAELVELHHFGGWTLVEIAKMLGLEEEQVKSRWRVAKARLKREMSTAEDANDA